MSLARRWWGVGRLLLGLALLAIVIARTGATRLGPQLRAAPWLLGLFIVQAVLGMVVEGARLRLLLRSQQVAVTFRRSLWICVTALPFGYVMPGGVGGDVMKIASLTGERRGGGVELTAVVMVDRMTGLASLLLVALTAAVVSDSFGAAPAPLRAAAVAAGIGLVVLASSAMLVWSPAVRASGAFRYVTTRLPLHGVIARLLDAFHAFKHHAGALTGALLMTAAGHILLIWFFAVAAPVVMDPVPPAGTIAWVGLLALVANVLPVTPGGLGVGEAAFAAAFGLMGYRGGAQLLILMRLGVIPVAAIGALRYMIGHRAGTTPPVSAAAADGG